jgi:hypothetical protein
MAHSLTTSMGGRTSSPISSHSFHDAGLSLRSERPDERADVGLRLPRNVDEARVTAEVLSERLSHF